MSAEATPVSTLEPSFSGSVAEALYCEGQGFSSWSRSFSDPYLPGPLHGSGVFMLERLGSSEPLLLWEKHFLIPKQLAQLEPVLPVRFESLAVSL